MQQHSPPPSISETFVAETHEAVPTFDSRHTGSSKRLVSSFEKLSPSAIEHARLESMKPFKRLPQTSLEIGVENFAERIDFPKRPQWNYDMTKEQVEEQETLYFKKWVEDVYRKYDGQSLSLFERNLEVWRQLWRVLEISDIILVVMDIRHPLLHFPRALYDYVTKDLKRSIIGIFNKVDLVSEFTVFAWQKYFEETFPELRIATFSCYPRDETLKDDTKIYTLKQRVKRPRKRYYHGQGIGDILRACSQIHLEKADRVDWDALIASYSGEHSVDENAIEEYDTDEESDTGSMIGLDDEFSRVMDISNQQIIPHKDYVTLGLVGHPNVGKSSLINSIMHRTVVSASRTPGHTKHFQTIHLTETVRLCDSPGLVFPTLLPRALQILSGMYPIAQVREPYSVIQYLVERIPVEKILGLCPPDLEKAKSFEWSAWAICEAYAIQRGFFTAKAARPDVYRAANMMLRLTTDGRILMSFKPPGFFNTTKYERLRVQEAIAVEAASHESGSSASDAESDEGDKSGGVKIQGGSFALLAEEDMD
ncbi:hypothetical protein BX666DRAFT_1891772 [Dichotomocladium elegans]|nr:hypothetical protein BX666DRAFT_1891772 [Dichotomocladium elegans]